MGANFLAPQFWDDKKLVKLGACAKVLFGCMICGPQISKVPGIFRASSATFYKSMRPFKPSEVEDAFKRILAEGIAIFDEDEEVIRLPNVNKYHIPPNPKQVIGWRRGWSDLPETSLKYDHLETLRLLAKRAKKSWPKAWNTCFGGIIVGDPSTYDYDQSWIPEDHLDKKPSRNRKPNPIGNGTRPPKATGRVSKRKKNSVYLFGEEGSREEEESDSESDSDSDTRYRKGTGDGIATIPVANGKDIDDQQNGRGNRGKSCWNLPSSLKRARSG